MLVSLSKGKKGSPRSKFFSSLMGKLAGDRGNQISQLFVDGKFKQLRKELLQIVDEIAPQEKVDEA